MKQSKEETKPKATPEKLSCENLTMLGNLLKSKRNDTKTKK